jgi:cytochrome c oxidase subunit IV
MADPAAVEQHTEQHHPGPREYVIVAVWLTVVTIIEVAIVYVDALRPVLVPLLLFLGFMKFILVVLWFMHLKFDSKLFRRLFAAGLAVALAVFTIVLVWFLALGGPAPAVGG